MENMRWNVASLKVEPSSGLRLTLWWVVGGFFWILAGAFLFSFEWGLYLGLYCFAIAPLLAVLLIAMSFRFQLWGLAQYRHDAADEITKSILKWHLKFRGPRPQIWIYPSVQVRCFLIPDVFRISRRQHVVLSHAFLRMSPLEQEHHLQAIWMKMSQLEPRGLRLYLGQLVAWFAVLSPLIFCVEVIDRVQSMIFGRRIHELGEWVQPLLFRLKEKLVGIPIDKELFLGASRHSLNLVMGFWDETLNDAKKTGNSAERELKPYFNELR